MKVNNLLVTGAAGFIGSNFVKFLSDDKEKICDRIIILDFLTYCGRIENLIFDNFKHPNYLFVYGDICDRDLLDRVFQEYEIDGVINFAAESHVDRSIATPRTFGQTNVGGTVALLDMAVKYKVQRFMQISTDEVYGSLGAKDKSFTEESPLKPNSPYSASKAGADCFALSYQKTFGLPVVVSRSSNNFGPNQFPEKFVPLSIINALQDKQIPIYGNGDNIRDWIYVDDNCSAIAKIFRSGRDGEIYNISGGNELGNLEVAKRILSVLAKSDSLIKFVADRPGHDFRYSLNSDKLKNELGWSPQVSFANGLDKTINFYSKNLLRYTEKR